MPHDTPDSRATITDEALTDHELSAEQLLGPGRAEENPDDSQPVPTEIPPATGLPGAAFGLWRDMPDEPFAAYEQPAVIYVADHGCWFRKPYPHVDAAAYYPRADHEVLHQRCAEAEALRHSYEGERKRLRADLYAAEAERDAALAALQAVVESWDTACAGCHGGGSCFKQRLATDPKCTDAIEAARKLLAGERDGG